MKRLIGLIAAVVLALGLAGIALAADEQLPHTGRVLISIGGDVSLPAGEQADAVLVVNGDARIDGTANTIVVISGTATLHGATTETVFVANGRAQIDATSDVLYGVRQMGSTVSAPSGVTVTDMSADLAAFGLFIGTAAVVLWIGFGVATVVVGLLLVALAARQLRTATDLISREPGHTALAGLLGLVLPPMLAVLAMATLIGIPVGVGLLVVAWPMVAFGGYLVGALWIGEWIQGRRAPGAVRPERPYGSMVIGLLIAFVLGFVPLFTFVVSFLGMGALLLAAWRTLRGRGALAVTYQPQAAPLAG